MTPTNSQRPLRPAAALLFQQILRRAVLAAARNIDDLQSQFDCAEIALALDLRDEARLMFEIAFIAGGYDASALKMQGALQRETRLWHVSQLRSIPEKDGSTAFHLRVQKAVAALGHCLSSTKQTPRPKLLAQSITDASAPDLIRVGNAVSALHTALQSPLDCARLAAAVSAIEQLVLSAEPFPIEEDVDATLDLLVARLASKAMQRFFAKRFTLLVAASASPTLLHDAAAFDRSELGPYFSYAANLVPSIRDLIGLVVATDLEMATAKIQNGLALLATGLKPGQLLDFLDVVADHGFLSSVRLIAARFGFVVGIEDKPILWKLRDTAIDLGDGELAISMQKLLCKLSPHSAIETEILVDLQANDVPHGFSSTVGRCKLRRSRRIELKANQGCD